MADIESGKQKMREYFQKQRERQNRPIKANIPNYQKVRQEDVYLPPQPIFVRQYQPQRPIVINEPQEKVRFNYPAFGFSMVMVGIITVYMAYVNPTLKAQILPYLSVFSEPMLILLGGCLFCWLSCDDVCEKMNKREVNRVA